MMVVIRSWFAASVALALVGVPYSAAAPRSVQQEPFSISSSQQQVDFTAQQVIRFHTSSSSEFETLLQTAYQLQLDVWSAHRGAGCSTDVASHPSPNAGCVDIRMASTAITTLSSQELLEQLMHPFASSDIRSSSSVLISDLQALIDAQKAESSQISATTNQTWHESYHTYDEISEQLHHLAQTYPAHAKVIDIGKTHEGRTIWGLKVGSEPRHSSSQNTSPKAGIVIVGEQHAREWISASTTTYFASELLRIALDESTPKSEGKGFFKSRKGRKGQKKRKGGRRGRSSAAPWTSKEARTILSTFDITFVPLTNPDGYAFSWEKNRMWRKNRQPNKFPSGLFCNGVDLNRNWGYEFATASAGALGSPCSELYPGTEAFSAAETRALALYLQDPTNNVKGFFDMHSYGQLLMYPFSYNCDVMVPDEEDLLELSLGAVKSLKNVHGRTFSAGKMCQVYAQSGGNAVDWAYASATLLSSNEDPGSTPEPTPPTPIKHKIKWSYSVELRDGGTYGFLLPSSQIIASSQEISKALVYMLGFIAKKEALLPL